MLRSFKWSVDVRTVAIRMRTVRYFDSFLCFLFCVCVCMCVCFLRVVEAQRNDIQFTAG